jgi:hypothetical protein
MKRVGIILSLTIIMILMSFSLCFASGLELEKSYPADGSNDARPENFLVKLYFNEVMSSDAIQSENESAFTFTDSKGKELKTKVLYDSKKQKEIWVLVDQTLVSNTSYKLHISGDLKDAKGNTLGEDKTISLKTRNISTDNNVNMAMMGIMMVGMIGYTSFSAKRQLKKKEEEEFAKPETKVNPYKLAKETGKSVEAVVAKTNKEKEKARAHAEKKNRGKQQAGDNASLDEDGSRNNDNKRVAGPKPIVAAGSTYITGRKALAELEKEKAAAKAATGTTRPKSATGKSKNKKSQGK